MYYTFLKYVINTTFFHIKESLYFFFMHYKNYKNQNLLQMNEQPLKQTNVVNFSGHHFQLLFAASQ